MGGIMNRTDTKALLEKNDYKTEQEKFSIKL